MACETCGGTKWMPIALNPYSGRPGRFFPCSDCRETLKIEWKDQRYVVYNEDGSEHSRWKSSQTAHAIAMWPDYYGEYDLERMRKRDETSTS